MSRLRRKLVHDRRPQLRDGGHELVPFPLAATVVVAQLRQRGLDRPAHGGDRATIQWLLGQGLQQQRIDVVGEDDVLLRPEIPEERAR